MNKKELSLIIQGELKTYLRLRSILNRMKAQGNISVLIKLGKQFDLHFDNFFNKVRGKYNEEEEFISNTKLLEVMDNGDLKDFIDFIKEYNEELKEEIERGEI